MSNEPTANVRQQMSQAVAKEVADGGWRVESQTDYHTVLAKGGRTNHVLHLILTIFTCGLWSLAWLLIAHLNRRQSLVLRVDEYGNFSRQTTDSKGALIGACVVAGVLLIGAIGGAVSGGDESSTATEDTDATTASTAASETAKPSPKANPKPKPPAKWVTVAKLAGSSDKAGDNFQLKGGCETRLSYNVDGGDMAIVAIYVMDAEDSLMEDGGFPTVSPEPGRGETRLRQGAGDYYLDVKAANADWSAEVQQKC